MVEQARQPGTVLRPSLQPDGLGGERDARGLLHVAGAGSCSWFDFARAIVSRAGSDCVVEPCTTAEFPRPARRPPYSVLASELGGAALPAWQDGLAAHLIAREVLAS